jgi:hypothetical protein
LLLRNSRDFTTQTEYETFVQAIVSTINRQCKTRFYEERLHLKSLPARRTCDFSELFVKVTPSSKINVKRVTYTIPSRLIGSTLLAHIYDDRLELFLGHEFALSLSRIRTHGYARSRSENYRHIIHSLAKKLNAFKNSLLCEYIIPPGDFTLLWKKLTKEYVSDGDCRYIVDLLLLAHNYDCEYELGRYVLAAYEPSNQVSIDQCRAFFGTEKIKVPTIITQQHSIKNYDSLIGGANS